MPKLLIVDSHPVQYRVPVYRELARLLAEQGGTLRVIYASDSSVRGAVDEGFGQAVAWDEPMLDGYDHEFLPGADQASPGGFLALKGAGIGAVLRRERPTAILLNGLNYLLFVRAMLAARRLRIPVWLRSETQDHAFVRDGMKAWLRSRIYRAAYAMVNHFFPIGRLNADHYRAHCVSDLQMTFCRYCVVDRFAAPAAELAARRMAKRAELGFADGITVVMFSGKLIPKKTPLVLIEALERMAPTERERFALLYVGAGEQEAQLRERAAGLGITAVFAGFVNQGAIADFYLASDAVILPSQRMGETWGLVANEALLAGRPVILSRHAGASADFGAFAGVIVIEPEAEAVATAFRKISSLPAGVALRVQMMDYTVEAAARAIASQCPAGA